MASAGKKPPTERRTLSDVTSDICASCHQQVEKQLEEFFEEEGQEATEEELQEVFLLEIAGLGHVKCLEAVLSLGAEKAAWNRDRSRRYAPGQRPKKRFDGFDAVSAAAENGRRECLQLLIKEKFPIDRAGPPMPVRLAAENGHTGCFDLLWKEHRERKSHFEVVLGTIRFGSANCMKMIISTGFDVSQSLGGRLPPLFWCQGSHKCVSIVKLLLKAGVDVNQEFRGDTALMQHALWGTSKCINTLIEAGADVNATSVEGHTPLLGSTFYNSWGVAAVLLLNGAKINIRNQYNLNPLTRLLVEEKIHQRPSYKTRHRGSVMILFAAGEKIDAQAMTKIPEYLQPELALKDICRRRIREHLLHLDPHTHLFGRVPKLELPDILRDYLLYEQTLDMKILSEVYGDDNYGDDDDNLME